MGSVSLNGAVWMVLLGIMTISIAFYFGLLWQTSFAHHFSRSRRRTSKSMKILRGGRVTHLKKFERIARDVVTDVESALEPPHCHRHARSFLPILSDVRRRGEQLLNQQTLAHKVTAPQREQDLCTLVDQLNGLEVRLKSLPKSKVTVEEVLLGKFE